MAKETVGELVYKITGDISDLKVAVTQSESKVKELEKQFTKAGTSIDKATGSAKIFKQILGLISFGAFTAFVKSSISAATDQQVANEKLANALSNVRGAREGDLEMLLQQANALQQTTRFADEQIVASQALLATFQLNGSAIQSLIPRILDMTEANAKLGDGSLDLQGATMAIGKAMTNGVGVLGRYGVAMTTAQEKAFNLGSESEKLQILTEILDNNFKGTAATVGQTFAGRLAIAKNAVGELQEDIGFALIPTIESLLGVTTSATKGFAGNQDRINTWGKAIFNGVQRVIIFVKSLGVAVTQMLAFGNQIINTGKIVFAFAKDVGANFFSIGERIGNTVAAIRKAFTGDFDGALEELKKSVTLTFENTAAQFADNIQDTKIWGQVVSEQLDSIAESNNTLENGYKGVSEAAVKSYRSMSDAATNAGDATKDSAKATEDELNNLSEKFEDTKQRGTDSLTELEKNTKDKLAGIDQKIQDLKQSLIELNDEFNRNTGGENKGIAERIVAEQQKIAELEAQLLEVRSGESPDDKRIQELEVELATRRTGLESIAQLETQFATEITEAKRRASLTDFERDIEDFLAKKEQLRIEYEERKLAIENEIALQEEGRAQTVALFEQQHTEIVAIIEQTNAQYQALSDARVEMTKKEVKAQIEEFNRLANAIARTKQGLPTQGDETKLPQFAVGGFVNAAGGEVHAGEYVIPANLVSAFSGLVGQIEKVRTGRSITNNRSVNAPITINPRIDSPLDMRALGRELSFELRDF